MKRENHPPYWHEGGTELCELCLTRHVLEMQVRCVACDQGLCAQCAVHVWETREVFCTECHAAERSAG